MTKILIVDDDAELCELDFDHYGRGPDHAVVIERLGDLFEECEVPAVRALP